MTPQEPIGAMVQLVDNPYALELYKADIWENRIVFAAQYLLDEPFFTELWGKFLEKGELHVLTDESQRARATKLATKYKTLHIKTWSYNRTMHTKVTVFTDTGASWIGSHNWTKGSWTLSTNSAARIRSFRFSLLLQKRIESELKTAKQVSAMR